MASSQKVPENFKFRQHIPTPTWHLPGTYPAHEFQHGCAKMEPNYFLGPHVGFQESNVFCFCFSVFCARFLVQTISRVGCFVSFSKIGVFFRTGRLAFFWVLVLSCFLLSTRDTSTPYLLLLDTIRTPTMSPPIVSKEHKHPRNTRAWTSSNLVLLILE